MVTDSLLNMHQVLELTGIRRTKIHYLRQSGDFPQPVKIGKAVRWKSSEIQAWIDGLPRAGDVSEE